MNAAERYLYVIAKKLSGGDFDDESGLDIDSMPSTSYLGGQTITCNNASQAATVPDGTKTIYLMAEGGAVYAAVNGAAADSSPVYCPQDQVRIIGSFDNISSFAVFGASASVKAHLVYSNM